MALSQSAVSDLLDAFRAGDGVDLIRESVRLVLQELIEVEATEVIGAGPYERTEARVNERNGNRPRLLPFVGSERLDDGRRAWAVKGLGREAPVRVFGTGNGGMR